MSKAEDYAVYLQSEHWRTLRLQAIHVHGAKCSNCNSGPIQVHHLRYGNWYDVTTDDLVPLCEACHDRSHKIPEAQALIWMTIPSAEKRRRLLQILSSRPIRKRKKPKHRPTSIKGSPYSVKRSVSKRMRQHLKILQRVEKHKRWLTKPDLEERLVRHHGGMLLHWEKKLKAFLASV